MINQSLVILTGLALAAWGHLLVHDLLGAVRAWTRLDGLFPVALRTPPPLAGRVLLLFGTLFVLGPILG